MSNPLTEQRPFRTIEDRSRFPCTHPEQGLSSEDLPRRFGTGTAEDGRKDPVNGDLTVMVDGGPDTTVFTGVPRKEGHVCIPSQSHPVLVPSRDWSLFGGS